MHTAAAIYSTSINNSPQKPVRFYWWYMRKIINRKYRAHIATHIAKFINISSLSWNHKQFSGLFGRIGTLYLSQSPDLCLIFFVLAVCLKKIINKSSLWSPSKGRELSFYLIFLGLLSIVNLLNKTDSGITISKSVFFLNSLLWKIFCCVKGLRQI